VSSADFIERFGGVYEHSPWVAEQVAEQLDGSMDCDRIAELMMDCVDNVSHARQLELIRAHPDLAGRARVAGTLTSDSSEEQSRAGLDCCSAEEFAAFQDLNARYKAKFGFPFVMAVRNSSREEILETFAKRLGNDSEAEFETALAEIHKIARLRIEALGMAK
jgi:2-oxo-4-hydroxy-4-carboxy-5-ureidoimidazoline decarboxylase